MTGLWWIIGFIVLSLVIMAFADRKNPKKKPTAPCIPVMVLGDDGSWHQLDPDECRHDPPDFIETNPHAM